MEARTLSMGWRVKRAIQVVCMQLSDIPLAGWIAVRFAGWMRGPYKDKRVLALLTEKPYISPRAQIRAHNLVIGPQCFIDDYVTIYAHPDGGAIRLGRGVHLYRGTVVEVGAGGGVTIGDDTHIQSCCNIKGFLGSTLVGSSVQIAPHCVLSPYQHGFDDTSSPIRTQAITSSGDIILEDDAWLGASAMVLDGVTVGRGAVIGAGSVVTKDIPPYSVAVGVPARVIRRRGES